MPSLPRLTFLLLLASGCVPAKEQQVRSVADKSALGTCDAAMQGAVVYLQKENVITVCTSGAWTDAPGAAAQVGKTLAATTPIPPGDVCRYGGSSVDIGTDKDGNNTLDATEKTTAVTMCDADIAKIAKATYASAVYSVALIITSFDYSADPAHKCACVMSAGQEYPLPGSLNMPISSGAVLGPCATTASAASGTGWVAAKDLVVTNAHVIERSPPSSCLDWQAYQNAAPATQTAMRADPYAQWPLEIDYLGIRHVAAYFPKTTLPAATLLQQGLPHGASFTPSTDDFEKFTVAEYDNAPTRSASDQADLALLHVPSARAPLQLSPEVVATTAAANLTLGDDVFVIGFPLTQGPRLAIANVFHMQTCDEWQKADYGETDTTAACASYHLAPSDRRFLFFGYGDHGGSGSPVFDRLGNVIGVFTWGNGSSGTSFDAAQFAERVQHFLAQGRSYSTIQ